MPCKCNLSDTTAPAPQAYTQSGLSLHGFQRNAAGWFDVPTPLPALPAPRDLERFGSDVSRPTKFIPILPNNQLVTFTPMSLSRPFSHAWLRWMTAFALLALAAPTLQAQRLYTDIFTRADRHVKGQAAGVRSTARTISLDVNVRAFKQIATSSLRLSNLPLAADVTVGLDLQEFSVLAPDAIVTITTARGVEPAPAPTVRLYRGHVTGEPNSQAFLAISDKGVMGSVTRAGGTYEIATDYSTITPQGTVAAIAYPFEDATLNRAACGVSETLIERSMAHVGEKQLEELKRPHISSVGSDDIVAYAVKGAFESDVELLGRFNGDQVATLDFILGTLGRVSNTYEHEVSTQIVAGYLNMWTTTGNGYPYTEAGNMQIAVQQVKDHWGTKATPARAFMQVLSGKDWKSTGITGIVTDINPLCNVGNAYSVALMEPLYHTAAYVTVSHELGHLFGAYHTHNCPAWGGQLDHCFFPEQGTCFNVVNDSIGTIMSYCSTIVPSFSPVIANFLKNATATRFNSGSSCVIKSKKLTIPPSVILFPKTDVGVPVDTVVSNFFQNNGQTDLTITGFTIVGTNSSEFQVIEPATLPFLIPAGQRKNLKIRYKATQEGASAMMTITHDAFDRPVKVQLEAYAIAQVAILNYRRIPNRSVNFGTKKVGEEDYKDFSYLNVGTATLHITSAEIVGPDKLDFKLIGEAPPFDLVQGDTAIGGIEFKPRTQGVKQAWLRVESNSTTGFVDSVPLTANVKTGPLLQMKAEGLMINFGEVPKTEARDTTIYAFFKNIGSDTMTLSTWSGGTDQLEFSVNSPVVELIPNDTLGLNVIFSPNAEKGDGWRRAYLVVYVEELDKFDTIQLIAHVGPLSSVPGTGATTDASFVISPNPTSGNALVAITPLAAEIGKEYAMRITDINGREVRFEKGRFGTAAMGFVITKGELPSGSYFITITTSEGTRSRSVTITE